MTDSNETEETRRGGEKKLLTPQRVSLCSHIIGEDRELTGSQLRCLPVRERFPQDRWKFPINVTVSVYVPVVDHSL